MNRILTPIDEKNYAEIMEKEVEPSLSAIRKDGAFISFDGKRIHYEAHITENAKAIIVISHGFTESAEKFREMAYYFSKNGYSVFSVDHRGHGESYRIPGEPNTVKIGKFSDYVKDLNVFVNDVVKPLNPGLPMYLYSHSMGGAIAGRYIQTYPEVFSKAILSAPMICANTGMPIPLAKILSALLCAVGASNMSVPGRCEFNPDATYENSSDTSEARFNYYHAKKLKNPHLRTCGPSFGWVKEAMAVTNQLLDPENCKKITAQVLIFQPETDQQVLSPYQDTFAEKIGARLIRVPGAKHEIYASTNDVLEKYLKDVFEFFDGES